MNNIVNFASNLYRDIEVMFYNDINYIKLKPNLKCKGKVFKSKSNNQYYSVVNKTLLFRTCSFEEFKCKNEFINDVKKFDSEKDCIIKLHINDEDDIHIKENQNIIIDNPSFLVLNNINNKNKEEFINNLENFIPLY